MTLKRTMYLAIIYLLGFIGELLFLGFIADASLPAMEMTGPTVSTIRSLGLPQRPLKLISVSPVSADGKTLGVLAVYDDPSTPRSEDYMELYDSDGELVAVGWFDRFGIQRAAVDRALIDGNERLQGVFVTIVNGQPI